MAVGALFLPIRTNAFWPFSAGANAAADVFVPTSSTPTLHAATNVDPNPRKSLGSSVQISDNAVMAYAGPSGTADASEVIPSDQISVYVVRQGDTLSEIANMFGVSANTIIWANNLSNARDVHPGDTLIILPISGVKRTIVKGDTLKSLAKKYGADPNEIAQFNGLDPSDPLAIGITIIIPGGEIAPASSNLNRNAQERNAIQPYKNSSGIAQTGYYSNPIPGAVLTQRVHGWNAVDIGAVRSTPIRAAAGGKVIVVRNNGGWNGGYGNYVVITHDNGSQTLYAHMKNAIVSSWQMVSSGQIIGYIGSTGESTGPHLHFEVRGAANPFRNCRTGTVCSPQ